MSISINEAGQDQIKERMKAIPHEFGGDNNNIPNDLLGRVANEEVLKKCPDPYFFKEEKVRQLKPLLKRECGGKKIEEREIKAHNITECHFKYLVKACKDLTNLKGWGYETLARAAGIHTATLSRMLNGDRVSEEKLTSVARVLGFDLSEYINIDDLSSEELWQRLRELAVDARNLMKIVLKEEIQDPELGARRRPRTDSPRLTVPLDSDLQFQINLDREGYLILLEREPSEKRHIVCLCPSEYAPNTSYATGETFILPQREFSEERFFAADQVGCEQYIAILFEEMPRLDWLEQIERRAIELTYGALELDVKHLKELVEYLKKTDDKQKQVYYRYYHVINSESDFAFG